MHPGHRVLHAKGVGAEGRFVSSGAAASLTTAAPSAARRRDAGGGAVLERLGRSRRARRCPRRSGDGHQVPSGRRVEHRHRGAVAAGVLRPHDRRLHRVRARPRARSGHRRDGPRPGAGLPRGPPRGAAGGGAVGRRARPGQLLAGDLPQRPRVLDGRRRRGAPPGALPLGAARPARPGLADDEAMALPPDYLARALAGELAAGTGPLRPARSSRARPGDPVGDPTAPWPDDRPVGDGGHARAGPAGRRRAADLRSDQRDRRHRVLGRPHPASPGARPTALSYARRTEG